MKKKSAIHAVVYVKMKKKWAFVCSALLILRQLVYFVGRAKYFLFKFVKTLF